MVTIDKVGILVCGSRGIGGHSSKPADDSNYPHYTNTTHITLANEFIERFVNNVITIEKQTNNKFNKENILIISGGAVGADDIARIWSNLNHYTFLCMPAQWSLYGKSAGYKRNVQMLNISKYVLALYDGTSRGTLHTITEAKKRKLKVKTVIFP